MITQEELAELIIKKCVYCGKDAECEDHVIPVSFLSDRNRRKNKSWNDNHNKSNNNLVNCCRECNSIASDKVFIDIDDKKDYIQEKLQKKYRKVLDMPDWTEKQINTMGINLATEIRIQLLAKKWILNRVNYPIEIYPRKDFDKEFKYFLDKHF